ncbi:tetratricopeptide repeat protein [Flavobacterium olei]|uniref:tetratricopeptide repeat protein n=1 Tax=Flavobacterium olei TaxID=1886782 RepID=UPI0032197809
MEELEVQAGVEAKKNNLDKAIVFLKKAIAIEDQLNYNDPPDWFFSVRHYLGVVLLKAGKYAEAEKSTDKIYKHSQKTVSP